jgi:hypothetical protein
MTMTLNFVQMLVTSDLSSLATDSDGPRADYVIGSAELGGAIGSWYVSPLY